MSCPDWTELVARREVRGHDADPQIERAWNAALDHLAECEPCRDTALAADPTTLFHRLPAPTVGPADLEAMKQAVHAMRRAQRIARPVKVHADATPWRRRAWQRAAAVAAVLTAAVVVGSTLDRQGAFAPPSLDLASTGAAAAVPAIENDTPPADAGTAASEPDTARDRELRFEIRLLEGSQDRGPDAYEVLAEASMTSHEGEEMRYSLGERYEVRFKLGAVVDERLRLEELQIDKLPPRTANKGRQLPPRELFRGSLDLQPGQPLTLILQDDRERGETLVVAITAHPVDPPKP